MAMNRGSMRQQITKGPMKKKVGLYKRGKRVSNSPLLCETIIKIFFKLFNN